jgi:hypothetical protein
MSELDGPPHDLPRLIEVLDRYEVEYLIGAAAYAYSAKRLTEDADCVVRWERANLNRLAGALRERHGRLCIGGMTDAEARALPVQIDSTTLDMAGMSTWMTDAGPFDVLAGLEASDGHLVPYEELVARSMLLYGDGFTIRAAALEDIIRAKELADRAKDREALPSYVLYGMPLLAVMRPSHSLGPRDPEPGEPEVKSPSDFDLRVVQSLRPVLREQPWPPIGRRVHRVRGLPQC